MHLDISQALKIPGITFGFRIAEPHEPMDVGGELLRFTKPVEVSGTFLFTGEDFLVRGGITAQYVAQCCRCLKDVHSAMLVSFEEEYAREPDEDNPDRYLYVGEKLDLSKMVEDLISLNTPMKHLCNEACKGLCPVCGADRNTTECSCEQETNSKTN